LPRRQVFLNQAVASLGQLHIGFEPLAAHGGVSFAQVNARKLFQFLAINGHAGNLR
jgi:hypothetical protein